MRLKIRVHPNSSQEKIEKREDCSLEVWMKEKAIDNKANLQLIKILKKRFNNPVEIRNGFTSRNKIIEIKE